MAEGQPAGRGRLLKPVDVAEHLQIDTDRLSKMRIEGTGPAFIKIGKEVRYHPADVVAFIDASRRTSTRGPSRA